MMLDHLRHRRFIDACVDGEIDSSLGGRVARHVTICPMCGGDAALTRMIKASLGQRTPALGSEAARVRAWARRHTS